MRRYLITSALVGAFFLYGLFVSQFKVQLIREELEPQNPPGFFDYKGQTNVHTILSQGSGTVAEIIAAAQETEMNFLYLTDLNLFSREIQHEGYHRQTLVMVGGQYSYLDAHILLYDSARRHGIETLGQAQNLLGDLLSQSGADADRDLVILAHPFKPGYQWTQPIPSGLDGIEVINLKSVWQKAWTEARISFLWSILIYPFHSQYALLRLYTEPREEVELWDKTAARKKFIGFGGVDATAKTASLGDWSAKFPSYGVSFSILSNHVLLRSEITGDFDHDRKKIMQALAEGQFYMSLDILANPKGFNAVLEHEDQTYPMGSQVKLSKGMKIKVRLPQKPLVPFEVVFLKDGAPVLTSDSLQTEMMVHAPGVYRVQVRVIPTFPLPDGRKWISWIYSNPFFVRGS